MADVQVQATVKVRVTFPEAEHFEATDRFSPQRIKAESVTGYVMLDDDGTFRLLDLQAYGERLSPHSGGAIEVGIVPEALPAEVRERIKANARTVIENLHGRLMAPRPRQVT